MATGRLTVKTEPEPLETPRHLTVREAGQTAHSRPDKQHAVERIVRSPRWRLLRALTLIPRFKQSSRHVAGELGYHGAMSAKIPVTVAGATGAVGQRMVALLADHPWFELTRVTASERSAGRSYAEATQWILTTDMPAAAAELTVHGTDGTAVTPVVLSALDTSVAGPVEERLATAGHLVVSNASSHRMDADVPLLVPEVNPDHLGLLAYQHRFGGGALVTNPNCSTIGLVLALAPLAATFGIETVHVVTLQAVSGAGYPGVPSLGAIDTLIPYIAGEEPKIERETRRILGQYADGAVTEADITVSATCTRVPVVDGHTECISLALSRPADLGAISEAWRTFRAIPQEMQLPSAPARPVVVETAPDWPQPRLHRDRGGGMTVTVGRLRECPVLGFKLVALSHNTVRGAAGGSLLAAELAVARGACGLAPPVDGWPWAG